MTEALLKVTAFVTRRGADGHELLLFEHPYAGLQIPAGTVKHGESHRDAVLREASEETGLAGFRMQSYLGAQERILPDDRRGVLRQTTVYARPDPITFDWAYLPHGALVDFLAQSGDFSQVRYREFDRVPDPQKVTMMIMGWVYSSDLTQREERHFYHLRYSGETDREWTVEADSHRFRLFWAAMDNLPDLIPPLDSWLPYLPADLFEQDQRNP